MRIVIILVVLFLDQISKLTVLNHFTDTSDPIYIGEYLNLVLVFNKGISFGLFSSLEYNNYVFAVLALIIVCYLLKWLKDSAMLWEKLALEFIIGGAIGNIVDRILHKAVVDFIQLHWHNYYWPSFNIADAAICFGVFILLIITLRKDNYVREEKNV